MKVKIYHNPRCGTSNKVLAHLRENGYEPEVIEYLKNPPSREELKQIIADLGMPVRDMMRQKASEYEALKDREMSDEELIDAMLEHPILINRPIVVTEMGTRLCRPAEVVEEILPD